MSQCRCQGNRSGRVWFRYGDGAWDNVVSRRPPICWECQPIVGQSPCVAYSVSFQVVTLLSFTFSCEERLSTVSRNLWGPISVRLAEPGTAIGSCSPRPAWVRWIITSRGTTTAPCLPEPIETTFTTTDPTPRIAELRNITITRLDGQPDPPQRQFTVTDQSGILYQRVAPTCPQVQITCDEECPPGTEPFCGCCCACPPLISEARSISSLIRSIR